MTRPFFMDCIFVNSFMIHSIQENNNFVFKYWDPWRWQRPYMFGKYSRTLIPVGTFRSSSRHSCGSWHSPHMSPAGLRYNPCGIHKLFLNKWRKTNRGTARQCDYSWLVSGRYIFFVPPSSLAVSYLSKSVDVGPNCVSSTDQVQGTASPGYHRQTN